MRHHIETLESIRDHCRAGTPLERDLCDWLGDALDRFLDQACADLDDAFGLSQPHGGVPWWMERAIARRDAELRALAEMWPKHISRARRAQEITLMCDRYAASAWLHERHLPEMPAHYKGTRKEHIWRAFRSGAKMPISERRLRSLLP